jgi:hypothetical protein
MSGFLTQHLGAISGDTAALANLVQKRTTRGPPCYGARRGVGLPAARRPPGVACARTIAGCWVHFGAKCVIFAFLSAQK